MNFTRHGLILFTADYERCVEFYTGTLGLAVMYTKDEPGSHLTCCALGDAYLMIEVGGPPPAARKSLEQNPTKLRFNVEDVEAAAAELRAKGVPIEVETYSWGTIANFTDPDGNLCSLRDEASFH
ncbi:VOC family protein [Nisaea nitritireducens]|uniref:VOC family protein n=1 Tax=Nisaea nitritireducens TaxID=568392 RepID=UPI0018689806|nr:VOC family protein [Nisaea nitritireducens]